MKSICEEIGYLWMQRKSSLRIQDVLEMSIMMAASVSGTGQPTAMFSTRGLTHREEGLSQKCHQPRVLPGAKGDELDPWKSTELR